MIAREARLRMKNDVEAGVPIARVARKYGVSRQSVYNVLRRPSKPAARPARGSKLDPFKPFIRGRLEAFDLPATTLLRDIRAQGYGGGITIEIDGVIGPVSLTSA